MRGLQRGTNVRDRLLPFTNGRNRREAAIHSVYTNDMMSLLIRLGMTEMSYLVDPVNIAQGERHAFRNPAFGKCY